MADWKSSYKEDREKVSYGGVGTLKLKPVVNSAGQPIAEDAKVARMRFLSDSTGVKSYWVHTKPQLSRLGKRFTKDFYCKNLNEGLQCGDCEADDFPKRKLYFYVYVRDILHVRQDNDKKWLPVEYYGDNYFVEPVNMSMLLITGVGRGGQTEDKFLMWDKRFGTLCDRNYDWARDGLALNTHYDLTPEMESSEEDAAITEARKTLQPLEDVVGKMISKPNDKKETDTDDVDGEGVMNGYGSIEEELFG